MWYPSHFMVWKKRALQTALKQNTWKWQLSRAAFFGWQMKVERRPRCRSMSWKTYFHATHLVMVLDRSLTHYQGPHAPNYFPCCGDYSAKCRCLSKNRKETFFFLLSAYITNGPTLTRTIHSLSKKNKNKKNNLKPSMNNWLIIFGSSPRLIHIAIRRNSALDGYLGWEWGLELVSGLVTTNVHFVALPNNTNTWLAITNASFNPNGGTIKGQSNAHRKVNNLYWLKPEFSNAVNLHLCMVCYS